LKRNFDVNFALGNKQGSLSFLALQNYTLGKSKKFNIGFGSRLTSYLGLNQYFITAPAQLTSGSTSPFILFQNNINNNLDSMVVKSVADFSLDAAVNFGYRIFQVLLNEVPPLKANLSCILHEKIASKVIVTHQSFSIMYAGNEVFPATNLNKSSLSFSCFSIHSLIFVFVKGVLDKPSNPCRGNRQIMVDIFDVLLHD
jgi:hypothetical protein